MAGFAATIRKYRVSEPAPNDMTCFGDSGSVERKAFTRRSIAVVRMYVPTITVNRSSPSAWEARHTSVDDRVPSWNWTLQKGMGKRIIQVAQ